MIGRLLTDIGNVVLVLLLTALPGSLFFASMPAGSAGGFLLAMIFLMPLAAAGLVLASPFLIVLRLLGHRSWWSRLCVAVGAGAFLGLALGFMMDSDMARTAITAPGPGSAAVGAGFGAVFGLWAGAWWCFLFRGRALRSLYPGKRTLPVSGPAARA